MKTTKRDWKEFKDSKLLWWVNRSLHLFGWAIVLEEDNGKITNAYPARVDYRGFSETSEEEGFQTLTNHLAENITKLQDEVWQ